jgi:hypothetical protein
LVAKLVMWARSLLGQVLLHLLLMVRERLPLRKMRALSELMLFINAGWTVLVMRGGLIEVAVRLKSQQNALATLIMGSLALGKMNQLLRHLNARIRWFKKLTVAEIRALAFFVE